MLSLIRQALEHGTLFKAGKAVGLENLETDVNKPFFNLPETCPVSIDSRNIEKGALFIALQGERTDGHKFVGQAVSNGAALLIIEKDKLDCLEQLTQKQKNDTVVITVRDSLQALIQMAKNWRARFNYEVVGVTGSVGKTTTKEMISHILKVARIPSCVSYKNQNTIIGLCLNILKMREDHQVAVFELGINQNGEMSALADILRPTKAIITSVAHSHTRYLGTLGNIAKEKKAVFTYFQPTNIGIINGDDQLLSKTYYGHPVVRFGLRTKNQVQARKIRVHEKDDQFATTFNLKLYEHSGMVTIPGNHEGRIYNALAAASLCYFLSIPFDTIVKALETFESVEGRFQLLNLSQKPGRIINDCYNANPVSMRAALLAFGRMKSHGAKIAVLGEMLELGEKEVYWHRHIGRILSQALSINHLLLVGRLAKEIERTAPITMKIKHVPDWQAAHQALQELLVQEQNPFILFKASNGVGLSNIVNKVALK